KNLFPEPFNTLVLDLLGAMATWHAYAKMRLHTDSTLSSFKSATSSLGSLSRKFSKMTASLKTRELPKESEARRRRYSRKSKQTDKRRGAQLEGDSDAQLLRFWNLCTYKFHALGDYILAIIRFGTTDSYSTQLVR
ncbi:hypothetical protein GGX14DRAFT_309807, partial [Mycena pura]